ncbi:MAG TPA: mechanosensitive ion channel domain-containing protein [Candidatus Saccharimonadia bacterium]|nr:mechanosensitive ion channel domain-containing protein [Candidatus Saccharimonadia bacterium]
MLETDKAYREGATPHSRKLMWRRTNMRLVPFAVVAIGGAVLSVYRGNVRTGTPDHKLLALTGVFIFVSCAVAFLHVLTNTIRKIVYHYLGPSRAGTTKFVLLTIGYVLILLAALSLLSIPVEKLLLGGAVTGIILGVAAQQALANFFASVILLVSQPFSVGDRIVLKSGGLGGEFVGVVVDIGMTHTKLQLDDERIVLLPNATVLSGSAIIPLKTGPTPHH